MLPLARGPPTFPLDGGGGDAAPSAAGLRLAPCATCGCRGVRKRHSPASRTGCMGWASSGVHRLVANGPWRQPRIQTRWGGDGPWEAEMMFASFSTPHPSASPSSLPTHTPGIHPCLYCAAPLRMEDTTSPSKPTLAAPRTRGGCCGSCPGPGARDSWAGGGLGTSVPCPSLVKLLVRLLAVWLYQAHPGIPRRCWLRVSEGSRGGFCLSPSCDLLRPG